MCSWIAVADKSLGVPHGEETDNEGAMPSPKRNGRKDC